MKARKTTTTNENDFFIEPIEPMDMSFMDINYFDYPKELRQAIEEIKDICNIEIRQAKMKRDKAIQKAIAKLM